jgi:hypothetical protein
METREYTQLRKKCKQTKNALQIRGLVSMKIVIGLAAKARSGKDTAAKLLLEHANVAAFALADPLKQGCQVLFNLSDAQAWDDNLKEIKVEAWGFSPREFFQRVGTEWMRGHSPVHWLMRADREINAPQVVRALEPSQLNHPDLPFILAAKAFFNLRDHQCWDENLKNQKDAFWDMSPCEMIALVKAKALADFPDFADRRNAMPPQLINEMAFFIKPNLDTENKNIIIIKDIRFENEAAYIRDMGGKIWHIVRDNAESVNQHSSELGIEIQPSDIVISNNGTIEEYKTALTVAWETLSHLHAKKS